jgi:hypothetical protein
MKRLSTLLTTTLIALIVLTAAPSAMADRGEPKGSNAKQVLNCAAAALNPAKRWYGKFGACIAYHRADDHAGKEQPPSPPQP